MRLKGRIQSMRRTETGAVAMIVALLAGTGVLLGAAAISVDVGSLYAQRRVVQNGADAAAFSLARTDSKATAGNIAIGNLVKFKVAGTYRHAVWIEEPATTVVSGGEEGGEDVVRTAARTSTRRNRDTLLALRSCPRDHREGPRCGTRGFVASDPRGILAIGVHPCR